MINDRRQLADVYQQTINIVQEGKLYLGEWGIARLFHEVIDEAETSSLLSRNSMVDYQQ